MPAIFASHFFSPIPNLLMLKPLFESEKIIIHCLASPALLFYLYLFPELSRKCYWSIWGKDLYFYRTLPKKHFYHSIYEFFRRKVIKNIGHIITYSIGDYELAREWYGTKATWHKSFMYPSNLYKEIPYQKQKERRITLLVGNSADPSNNHFDAFKLLKKFKNEDIKIIVPLSYGNKHYAKQVIKMGKSIFNDKFTYLDELMPLNEYLKLLSNIDIGVFSHHRQQAMGNITTLLGMGKKVYLRRDVTTWRTLEDTGAKLFELSKLNLELLDSKTKDHNKNVIKNTFSEEALLRQWNNIAASKP